MLLSDFDFHLPKDLIASFPPEDRPSARLLQVERASGKFSHHTFRDLGQFLKKGDVLVLNNTKVLPARLFGKKESGGGVEALLLKKISGNQWEALIRPNRRVRKNMKISFGQNGTRLTASILDDARPDSGQRLLEFQENSIQEKLDEIGHIPLPPYLDRADTEIDRRLYQTVFAASPGAVASPTAGLHFDRAMLEALETQGIEIVYVTLHVGYGTFQPVVTEDLSRHQMEEESFEVSQAAADQINQAVKENRRVIACGTTSVRVLESAADAQGKLTPQTGKTSLFVYPSYRFKITQGLITNFHLPKSTLLLLVAAFLEDKSGSGREKLFQVYEEAIRGQYRFYSYGDAMVII